ELARSGVSSVVVEDTRLALQHYAQAILQRWHPVVIAVTGSTGKTSTKEAIAAVLASNYATFKSWQNYNDLLGLPLSLGRLEERHEYAVLEMGCDHPGEIEQLCALTHPTIGVLTSISPYQLQYFGSMQHLATEFAALLNCLPANGAAFVGDLNGYTLPAEIKAPLHSFGVDEARGVELSWQGIQFHMVVDGEGREIELQARLLGRHAVATLLAAYRVGRHCGVAVEAIVHALERFEPVRGRLHVLPGLEGATLLDDTHNACPASVNAGLATLRELPAGLRIAVLGDMLRLGEYEAEGHRLVGVQATSCVDYLITRGERAAHIAEAARQAGLAPERTIATATHEDAARVVQRLVHQAGEQFQDGQRCAILVKGSEETRMERVSELLMAQPEQAPEELVRQTPGWKQIVLMRPERPTWLEIDLSAIANNTRRMQALIGSDVRVLVSLKADGYGHGALKVARTALHNGASMLGVATVSEAAPLREAGIRAPILVFGYVPLWQMREAVYLDLTITLYTLDAAQALARTAQALDRIVRVHVKVDTGMGRLGVRSEQMADILDLMREVKRLPYLELEGLFTHFAKADAQDLSHTHLQLERFQQLLQMVEAQGLRPPLVH
ncbi:MAG: alanine racemase, partial [Ktedonobacteraceae bacterium]